MPRPHLTFGADIPTIVDYLHRLMPDGSRPPIIGGTLPADRGDELVRYLVKMTPRIALGADARQLQVIHVTLSLPKGIWLDDGEWEELATIGLRRLGIPILEVPWQMVRHTDKSCDHVHMLVMLRTFSGRQIELFGMKARCEAADIATCAYLGIDPPDYFDPGLGPSLRIPAPARRLAAGPRARMMTTIQTVMTARQPTTFAEFKAALAEAPDPVSVWMNRFSRDANGLLFQLGPDGETRNGAVPGKRLSDALTPDHLTKCFRFAALLRLTRLKIRVRHLMLALLPHRDVITRVTREINQYADRTLDIDEGDGPDECAFGRPFADRAADPRDDVGWQDDARSDHEGRGLALAPARPADPGLGRGQVPDPDAHGVPAEQLQGSFSGRAEPGSRDFGTGKAERADGGALVGSLGHEVGASDPGEGRRAADKDGSTADGRDHEALGREQERPFDVSGRVTFNRLRAMLEAARVARVRPQLMRAPDVSSFRIAGNGIGVLRLFPNSLRVEQAPTGGTRRLITFCRALSDKLRFRSIVEMFPWLGYESLRPGDTISARFPALSACMNDLSSRSLLLTLDDPGMSSDTMAKGLLETFGASFGERMPLSKFDGSSHRRHVVLALSRECRTSLAANPAAALPQVEKLLQGRPDIVVAALEQTRSPNGVEFWSLQELRDALRSAATKFGREAKAEEKWQVTDRYPTP